MLLLLAQTAQESTGFLPPNLLTNIVVSLIFLAVALAVFPLMWKLIDLITPGDLNKELLGDPAANKPPNLAIAIVVAALVLGFCIILAAAIH